MFRDQAMVIQVFIQAKQKPYLLPKTLCGYSFWAPMTAVFPMSFVFIDLAYQFSLCSVPLICVFILATFFPSCSFSKIRAQIEMVTYLAKIFCIHEYKEKRLIFFDF